MSSKIQKREHLKQFMENRAALLSALEWYVDAGVTVPVDVHPNDRFSKELQLPESLTATDTPKQAVQPSKKTTASADIIKQAQSAAAACSTLDELRDAIMAFDAHPLKKLATNMVFADGNPQAHVMVIGDPPATDEDRNGHVYCGADGQLLDKIFDCIGLKRDGDKPENSIYLTHLLNWRPPGNRTPTDEEIAISLPFAHKHIELIAPKYLILMGGIAGKAILQSSDSMSRMRGKFHEYGDTKIQTLTTYTPAFLMSNPLQKRKVWNDMLALRERLNESA
jgi:uracil-DNA glycosylase family 4